MKRRLAAALAATCTLGLGARAVRAEGTAELGNGSGLKATTILFVEAARPEAAPPVLIATGEPFVPEPAPEPEPARPEPAIVPPPVDTDKDGLTDDVDRCIDQPEDADGFQDDDGCPDPDDDADGLADAVDGCVREAGPSENRGCPDADRDGDSLIDRLDNCPDEPGPAANQGCAQKQLVVIRDGKLDILETVYFKTGSDLIEKRSFELLDNVASVIMAHPEIVSISVEGHTDDVGDDASNLDLSQRRAESVRNYLMGKGVPAERLAAHGYGETQPIVPNTGKAARAKNRRVVFRIGAP